MCTNLRAFCSAQKHTGLLRVCSGASKFYGHYHTLCFCAISPAAKVMVTKYHALWCNTILKKGCKGFTPICTTFFFSNSVRRLSVRVWLDEKVATLHKGVTVLQTKKKCFHLGFPVRSTLWFFRWTWSDPPVYPMERQMSADTCYWILSCLQNPGRRRSYFPSVWRIGSNETGQVVCLHPFTPIEERWTVSVSALHNRADRTSHPPVQQGSAERFPAKQADFGRRRRLRERGLIIHYTAQKGIQGFNTSRWRDHSPESRHWRLGKSAF